MFIPKHSGTSTAYAFNAPFALMVTFDVYPKTFLDLYCLRIQCTESAMTQRTTLLCCRKADPVWHAFNAQSLR